MAETMVSADLPGPSGLKSNPLHFWARILYAPPGSKLGKLEVEVGVQVLRNIQPPWPGCTKIPVDIVCTGGGPGPYPALRKRLMVGLTPETTTATFSFSGEVIPPTVVTAFTALKRCLAFLSLQLDSPNERRNE